MLKKIISMHQLGLWHFDYQAAVDYHNLLEEFERRQNEDRSTMIRLIEQEKVIGDAEINIVFEITTPGYRNEVARAVNRLKPFTWKYEYFRMMLVAALIIIFIICLAFTE